MIGTFRLPLASTGSTVTGFITEWVVSGDTAARTIGLPLVNTRTEGALAYNCIVYWGDTTSSIITTWNDSTTAHTYASNGTYQVNIAGTCEGWSFNNAGDKLKITKVINFGGPNFNGFKYLASGFYGCSNLNSLGSTPIKPSGTGCLAQGFGLSFNICTSLSAITTGLFKYNTIATNFYGAFYGCSALVTLPSDLFGDSGTAAGATTFLQAFQNCTALKNLPTDLFRYNSGITIFTRAFQHTGLTGITADTFRYNTLVTNFDITFYDCASLVTLPTDIFRYNTLVTDFTNVVALCPLLATVSADLFRYNTKATGFIGAFYGCLKLQLHTTIFCTTGQTATRFSGQTINLTSCFDRASFTGTQGTAPDLWNYTFGTVTSTDCFNGAGNSLTSLTNYASIPAPWL